MPTNSYAVRRGELKTYFDQTAVEAWARLTSDAPVSGIRATVRKGRDAMRATLLGWLPEDLTGKRILDAGCGTGALALAAARRGAHVVAIDLSPTLVGLAGERAASEFGAGHVDFRSGDMFDPALGEFDHVVAMDSLIHYQAPDVVRVLNGFAARTRCSVLYTFAPANPLLSTLHVLGKLFPRSDRSPAIVPTAESKLRRLIAADPGMAGFAPVRTTRIASGFYTSQAMEVARA